MKISIFLLAFVMSGAVAEAQFSSRSTGADGALVVNVGQNISVQVPPSGVFNFTTVNISGTLSFIPNQRNTPVIILAQGDVVIDQSYGQIFLDASGQTPGPGGFFGGAIG